MPGRLLRFALPLPSLCNCGNPFAESFKGIAMADHSEVAYTTADGNDYKEHEQTYLLFLTLTKWGIGIVAVILLLMAYFLV